MTKEGSLDFQVLPKWPHKDSGIDCPLEVASFQEDA